MLTNRIEINPAVMLGKPVIRGTRIPVERVEFGGLTVELDDKTCKVTESLQVWFTGIPC